MLTPQNYLNALGQSIHAQQIVSLFDLLKIDATQRENSISGEIIEDIKNGLYFGFIKKERFENIYGQIKSPLADSSDDLILTEITFDNDFARNKQPFRIPLPYNLKTGDSADTIIQKLDKKPYEKSKSNHL